VLDNLLQKIRKSLIDYLYAALTTSSDTDAFMTMLAHKHKTATDVGTPIIIDDGDNCFRCGGRITKGQVAVKTTRVLLEGQPAVFHHDSCFCCDVRLPLLI
jgi:hypothetical protein